MSVEKIILRSFLTTLLAILMLLVFMVGVLVLVYPETMMNVAYDMGMEKSSIWYAERAYKRHGKIETIAFATTIAIEENMYDKIISCGGKMILDESFDEYCAEKDEENFEKYGDQAINGVKIVDILGEYDQYVYAQISVAMYRTGDKDGAIEKAVDLTEGFSRNNAIACLLIQAESENDEIYVDKLLDVMDALQALGGSLWEEKDQVYFNEIQYMFMGGEQNA